MYKYKSIFIFSHPFSDQGDTKMDQTEDLLDVKEINDNFDGAIGGDIQYPPKPIDVLNKEDEEKKIRDDEEKEHNEYEDEHAVVNPVQELVNIALDDELPNLVQGFHACVSRTQEIMRNAIQRFNGNSQPEASVCDQSELFENPQEMNNFLYRYNAQNRPDNADPNDDVLVFLDGDFILSSTVHEIEFIEPALFGRRTSFDEKK